MTEHSHRHSHAHGRGLGSDHAHGGGAGTPLAALATALAITGAVFVAELVGGWISGSMALMADAMHMLSDATGLIIALLAVLIGARQASPRATFGYRRVEVLAAAVNAVSVCFISIWIVVEAIQRLHSNGQVDTRTMMVVAVIGLVANTVSALVLNSSRKDSINVEGAFLHVIVDMLGSVAVIVAGAVIMLTGFQAADAIASLLIAALVLPRAWALLRTSTSVLLERVPHGIDPAAVSDALLDLDRVDGLHDLHLWSTSGNNILCSVHLIAKDVDHGALLDHAQARLGELGIDHATIQIERPGHTEHEVFCPPHETHERR